MLEPGDVVGAAQCIAIDADVFPYESARFGKRPASAVVWVAREKAEGGAGKGRVVGFLAARARVGRLEIDGVAVDGPCRRRGIGRDLVRGAVAWSRKEALRVVVLHVWVQNLAAIALYESEGFTITRRFRNFYPVPAFGENRDAFEMMREIAQSGAG